MALYSVYEPNEPSADPLDRGERLIFVKDGFSWVAFLVAPLWLIYHRMWLGLVLLFGGLILLDFVIGLSDASKSIAGWAALAYVLFFAMEANDLRRYSLERKGYHFLGMAFGGNREEAEVNFFNAWLPEQRRSSSVSEAEKGAARSPPAAKTGAQKSSPSGGPGDDEIIGSFPNA